VPLVTEKSFRPVQSNAAQHWDAAGIEDVKNRRGAERCRHCPPAEMNENTVRLSSSLITRNGRSRERRGRAEVRGSVWVNLAAIVVTYYT